MTSLIFLILVLTGLDAQMISQTAGNEGARWEKIGDIKAIADYKSIEFTFDIRELNQKHEDLKLKLKKMSSVCESQLCKDRLKILDEGLTQSHAELDVLLSHVRKAHSRAKRMDSIGNFLKWGTGIMDSEDRENINSVNNNIQSDLFRMSIDTKNVKQDLSDIKTEFQTRLDQLYEIESLATSVLGFTDRIKSLRRIVVTKKFETIGGVVETTAIDDKLKEIMPLIDSNHELPFSSGTLCKMFLEVEAEIKLKSLTFSMQIPIVNKRTLNLNKFVRTPIKISNSVAALNLDVLFVVLDESLISSSKIKIVDSLNSCIRRFDKVYICDIESTAFKDNYNKCLANIVLNETFDAKLCANELFIARLPNRVYICNDAQELWFNSDIPKTLKTKCSEEEGNLTITGSSFITPNETCVVALTKGEDEGEEMAAPFKMIKLFNRKNSDGLTFVGFNGTEFSFNNLASLLENDQFYDMDEFIKTADKLTDSINPDATSVLQKAPTNQPMRDMLFVPVILAMVLLIVMLYSHEKFKAPISDLPIEKICR